MNNNSLSQIDKNTPEPGKTRPCVEPAERIIPGLSWELDLNHAKAPDFWRRLAQDSTRTNFPKKNDREDLEKFNLLYLIDTVYSSMQTNSTNIQLKHLYVPIKLKDRIIRSSVSPETEDPKDLLYSTELTCGLTYGLAFKGSGIPKFFCFRQKSSVRKLLSFTKNRSVRIIQRFVLEYLYKPGGKIYEKIEKRFVFGKITK
jgi:hypothetical protein